jgi:hypothetical protein
MLTRRIGRASARAICSSRAAFSSCSLSLPETGTAAAAAAAAAPRAPRPPADPAAAALVAAAVRAAARPVVVFGRSYCRVSRDLAERLDDGLAAGSVADIALDRPPPPPFDAAALRAALTAATGQEHSPFCFVGGAFVPTEEALRDLRRGARDDDCAMRPRLETAGVKVTGPFRA